MKIADILLATFMMSWAFAPAQAATPQTAARAAVDSYYNALFRGDTATLKSILGGKLLAKRLPLLDNPDYPAHLVATYGRARYQVIGNAMVNDGSTVFDTRILFGAQDAISYRITLKASTPGNGQAAFKIIDISTSSD